MVLDAVTSFYLLQDSRLPNIVHVIQASLSFFFYPGNNQSSSKCEKVRWYLLFRCLCMFATVLCLVTWQQSIAGVWALHRLCAVQCVDVVCLYNSRHFSSFHLSIFVLANIREWLQFCGELQIFEDITYQYQPHFFKSFLFKSTIFCRAVINIRFNLN